MQRLAAVAITTVLAGCLNGTTTPGLKRCVRYYILIGFVTECEEGPNWARGVNPPDPPRAEPVSPARPTPPATPAEPPVSTVPAGEFCFFVIPDPTKHAERRCVDTMEHCRIAAKAVRPPAEVTIDCEPKRE